MSLYEKSGNGNNTNSGIKFRILAASLIPHVISRMPLYAHVNVITYKLLNDASQAYASWITFSIFLFNRVLPGQSELTTKQTLFMKIYLHILCIEAMQTFCKLLSPKLNSFTQKFQKTFKKVLYMSRKKIQNYWVKFTGLRQGSRRKKWVMQTYSMQTLVTTIITSGSVTSVLQRSLKLATDSSCHAFLSSQSISFFTTYWSPVHSILKLEYTEFKNVF
jgi:hypothetical protein